MNQRSLRESAFLCGAGKQKGNICMESQKNTNRIKEWIIAFYNNQTYQELKTYYGKTTLFNILKIERNENRHSAFLAWLLDENGSHGLGEGPLKRFMRLLSKMDNRYNEPFLVGNYEIENTEIITEKPVKGSDFKKSGRIDIFIDFDYKTFFERKEDIYEKRRLNHVHIIIENKVYTDEHDDQTKLYIDWARQEFKGKHNQTIIGVFLAPEKPDKCSGDIEGVFNYVKITYQDLLEYVIEPLLLMKMPQEARVFITDYIINLGQPVQDKKDGDENSSNQDTILAISNENREKFIKLYESNQELLDATLYANSYERNEKQLAVVYSDLRSFKSYSETELGLLKDFWVSNKKILRMILNTALKSLNENEDYQNAVNVLLRLTGNNRDNTKYMVYSKDGELMNEGKKPVPKSLASFYIFKAWMHDHRGANLRDIREAFPVGACAEHYLGTYQYLFYRKEDIENALENNKTERTYYIASLDEDSETTKKAKKYLTWDFFNDNKHCLEIQNEKVLNVKMWLKDEFDHLIDYAKNKNGIMVMEK